MLIIDKNNNSANNLNTECPRTGVHPVDCKCKLFILKWILQEKLFKSILFLSYNDFNLTNHRRQI
jgi:hypothetical protein